MDFGKLANIQNVNFNLPADHADNLLILPQKQATNPQIFVGCPVWANPDWKGKIYPQKAKNTEFLYHYSRQFNCIELNSTHYNLPNPEKVRQWKQISDPNFRFCPKILQDISHEKLANNTIYAVNLAKAFFDNLSGLEEKLALSFMQLPPSFSPKKASFLINFLEKMPKNIDFAIEFRHQDWFNDSEKQTVSEVFELMKNLQIATVITDVAGRRDVLHQRLTCATVAIRFVGNALDSSDYSRIDAWVNRLKIWLENGLENLYFWVHEPDNLLSPDLANYFIKKMNKILEIKLKEVVFYQNDGLF
ncbi:MAG: DUF72 domain-containing protein [Bacteroidetes bacterium]|nr:MAG: DUF72 domain-containing protein [Bacteroidota bacterium]